MSMRHLLRIQKYLNLIGVRLSLNSGKFFDSKMVKKFLYFIYISFRKKCGRNYIEILIDIK